VIKAGIAFVVDYIKKKILCLHCWWNQKSNYK
jgi:hypothetical protein